MKIFISYAGERSHRIALLLRDWTQQVIQTAEPLVSGDSIDRGAVWSSMISKELISSTYGIICLTSENQESNWIAFEAGLMSAVLSPSRTYILLGNILSKDVKYPLAQLNHIQPSRDGLLKLVLEINNGNSEGTRLRDDILYRVFDVLWPSFEQAYKEIFIDHEITSSSRIERSEQEILYEILNVSRSLDKRVGVLESTNHFDYSEATSSKFSDDALLSNQVPLDYYLRFWLARGKSQEAIINDALRKYPRISNGEVVELLKIVQSQE